MGRPRQQKQEVIDSVQEPATRNRSKKESNNLKKNLTQDNVQEQVQRSEIDIDSRDNQDVSRSQVQPERNTRKRGRPKTNQSTMEDIKDNKQQSTSTKDQKKQTNRRAKKTGKQTAQEEVKEARKKLNGSAVKWRQHPSADDLPRIEKAQPGSGQRLYMIERKVIRQLDDADGPSEQFTILGSTKNVYEVEVSRYPKCTCPDFKIRQKLCKHFFYVMLRVLKVDSQNPLVWQNAYLPSEVRTIFEEAASKSNNAQDCMANNTVVAAYRQAMGHKPIQVQDNNQQKQRAVQADSDCGICYDVLIENFDRPQNALQEDINKLAWCINCGNSLHQECFQKWEQSQGGKQVKCIYCRQPWSGEDNLKNDRSQFRSQGRFKYINIDTDS